MPNDDDNYFDFGGNDTKEVKSETKVVNSPPQIPIKKEICDRCENEFDPDQLKDYKKKSYCSPCLITVKDEEREEKRKRDEEKQRKDSEKLQIINQSNPELDNKIKQLETKILTLEQKSNESFENKIKELKLEQEKTQAQIQLMTSFENMVKNLKPNNILTYYDVDSVIAYIKKQLNLNLDDSALRSKKQIQALPDWNKYTAEQKDMLIVLVRCLREGKSFEKFNKIQLKMNEEKTH